MRDALWDRVDAREAEIVERYLAESPVKLGEIARELGLQVFRSPLPPSVSGMIKPSDRVEGTYEIKLNKYEVAERQRFTLAHELAHFLLHKQDIRAGVIDNIMYRSALTSRKEYEANRLAADIVMPKGAVSRELQARGGVATEDVAKELALVFKVSPPAMRIRLGLS